MIDFPCKCGKEGFVTVCPDGWRVVNGKYVALGETFVLCDDCIKERDKKIKSRMAK